MRPLLVMFIPLLFAVAARAEDAALLPILANGATESDTRDLEAQLRVAAKSAGIELQPSEVTAKKTASARSVGVTCGLDVLPCLVSMGKLSGTARVLVGRLRAPQSATDLGFLELQLVDVTNNAFLRKLSKNLPPADPDRERTLRGALLLVLAPERTGGIEIRDAKGSLYVDGLPYTGALRVDGLAEGEHHLELRDPTGVVLQEKNVVIVPGAVAKVAFGGPIGPWIAGGGGAVAAIAGITALGFAVAADTPTTPETRDVYQGVGIAFLGLTAAGIALAAIGGGIWATEVMQ